MLKTDSSLIFRTIKAFQSDTYDRDIIAAEERSKQDHARYMALADLLDISIPSPDVTQSKSAAEESIKDIRENEKKLEMSKQKKLRVDNAKLTSAFSRIFRDLLRDYLPGGSFREESLKDLADNFYRYAYSNFKKLLPKLIDKKLKDVNIEGISGSDINLDAETMNHLITDMVLHMKDHPTDLKLALLRAYDPSYRKKDKNLNLGMGEVFFSPTVTNAQWEEILKDPDARVTKRRPIDKGVLERLSMRDKISFHAKGVDENGILHFTIPKLYNDRVFSVKLPKDIPNVRPDDYTFEVQDHAPRGLVLKFDLGENINVDEIEENGLTEDQMRYLINNGFISNYVVQLRKLPTEKLFERFTGKIFIKGKPVDNVDSISDLIQQTKDIAEVEIKPKTKSEQAVLEKHEELEEEVKEKNRAALRAIDPVVYRNYLSMPDDDGRELVNAIGSFFPRESISPIKTNSAVFTSQPIIRRMIETMLSSTTPEAKGSIDEVMKIFMNDLPRLALKDPGINRIFKLRILHDKYPDISKVVLRKTLDKDKKKKSISELLDEITDQEVLTYIRSLKNVNKMTKYVKDEIKDKMLEHRNHPALKKFFGRIAAWKRYMDSRQGELDAYIEKYIEEQGLTPGDPDFDEKIENTQKNWMERQLKRTYQPSGMEDASRGKGASSLYKHIIRIAMRRHGFNTVV